MERAATIKDIARKLNVSISTVSRAMRGAPDVSADTKRTVMALADELNYQPNLLALSLKRKQTHTIGVLVPNLDYVLSTMVKGIDEVALEAGYTVMVCQSNESFGREIVNTKRLLDSLVDGFIVSVSSETKVFDHLKKIQDKKMPMVVFDRVTPFLKAPGVRIDNEGGGFQGTEHLIQQGYKRIAHLAGPQWVQTFQNRLRGYNDALKAYNYKTDDSLIYTGDISIEKGKKAADYFLELAEPPDAVFAVEDFSALGLIKQFKEKDIKIPDNVGIIGFANEDFGEHISPTLSSIDQQTVQMGREAFSMLMDLIKSGEKQYDVTPKVVLDPIPFYRESSMKEYSKKREKLTVDTTGTNS